MMEEREFSQQGRHLAVIGSCVFCRNGHDSCVCNFMRAHSNGGSRQQELLYWLLTSLDVNWVDISLLFIILGCCDMSLYNASNISNNCSCYMAPFSLSQIFCQLCYLVLCVLSFVDTFDPRRICSIISTWVQFVSVSGGDISQIYQGAKWYPPSHLSSICGWKEVVALLSLGVNGSEDESDRSFPSGAEAEIGQRGLRLRSVPHMSSPCDGKEAGAWRWPPTPT
jgi:hypothetical protein